MATDPPAAGTSVGAPPRVAPDQRREPVDDFILERVVELADPQRGAAGVRFLPYDARLHDTGENDGVSAAASVGLSIHQEPISLLLGVITGVLETIPFVGPIVAGTLAVLTALGHPAPFGWSQLQYAVVVALMYTVLRYTEDYVVIPQVIGRIVELHPVVVIFSLLIGGAIAGLLGILVAVPVAASLRIALLFMLAKLRDEDPYRVLAEAVAVPDEQRGVSRRPA